MILYSVESYAPACRQVRYLKQVVNGSQFYEFGFEPEPVPKYAMLRAILNFVENAKRSRTLNFYGAAANGAGWASAMWCSKSG